MPPLERLKTASSHIQTRKSQTVTIRGGSVTDARIGTKSTFNDCVINQQDVLRTRRTGGVRSMLSENLNTAN